MSHFSNPSVVSLSPAQTDIICNDEKPISTSPHVVSTFGSEWAPFWCLVHEGCLKTYVLISKQWYVCVYVSVERRMKRCTHERKGWNNHPFNSRIPADAIFIVLIDCDYSDSWCAHGVDEYLFIWSRNDTELTLSSFLTRLQIELGWCVLRDHTFPCGVLNVSFLTNW